MAGNNKIQFLRGTREKRLASTDKLNAGQPFFETDTNMLYIGDGNTTLANASPIVVQPSDITCADLTVSVNGVGSVYNGQNSVNLGALFTPTSAGTSGQFLTANSSGMPVWSNNPLSDVYSNKYSMLANNSIDITIPNARYQYCILVTVANRKDGGFGIAALSSAGGSVTLFGQTFTSIQQSDYKTVRIVGPAVQQAAGMDSEYVYSVISAAAYRA